MQTEFVVRHSRGQIGLFSFASVDKLQVPRTKASFSRSCMYSQFQYDTALEKKSHEE